MSVELPDDLVAFLKSGRALQADPESFDLTLLPLGEHVLGEVWIDPSELAASGGETADPHAGTEGYTSCRLSTSSASGTTTTVGFTC